MSLENDVIALQERILYLEDSVQSLSDQLAEHQGQLARYEIWFKRLSDQLQAMPEGAEVVNQKPPHY